MSAERNTLIALIEEAQASGARQSHACEIVGISAKTLQRWRQPDTTQDRRLDAQGTRGEQGVSVLERQR